MEVKGAARWTGEMNVRSSPTSSQLFLARLESALGVVHGLRGVGGFAGGAPRGLTRRVGGGRGLFHRGLGLLLLALHSFSRAAAAFIAASALVASRRAAASARSASWTARRAAAAWARSRSRRASSFPRPADFATAGWRLGANDSTLLVPAPRAWTITRLGYQSRQRIEARRLDVGGQAPGGGPVGDPTLRGQSLQVEGHATQHVRAWRVTVPRQKHRGLPRQLVERLALRLQRIVNVDRLAGEPRGLRLPELRSRRQQPVEPGTFLPEELVDHPGRNRRLGQPSDLVCLVFPASLLQARGQSVPGAGELVQRQLEQGIEVGREVHRYDVT